MTVPQEVTLARHAGDLDDDGHEFIERSVTTETDTTLRLAPDGTGGVEWGTGSGGGPADIDTATTAETDTTLVLAPDGVGGVEWVTPTAADNPRWEPVTTNGTDGVILITDTSAGSPLVFADLLQNEDEDDLLYQDSPVIVYSGGDIVMTWRTY